MKKLYLIKLIFIFNFFSLYTRVRDYRRLCLAPEPMDNRKTKDIYNFIYGDVSLKTIDDFFLIFDIYDKELQEIKDNLKIKERLYFNGNHKRISLKNKYNFKKKLSKVKKREIKEKYQNIIDGMVQLDSKIKSIKVLIQEKRSKFYLLIGDLVKIILNNSLDEVEKKEIDVNWLEDGNSYAESSILSKTESIFVIGDIHGNLENLTTILYDLINKKILKKNFKLNPDNKIIFLGDIVDRGKNSLKSVLLLMILKYLNPINVIYLRGNHENLSSNSSSDFNIELRSLFGLDGYYQFDKYFKTLPCLQVFKTLDDHILIFNHAGWSSDFYNNKDIEKIFNPEKYQKVNNILIDYDLLKKLTWNDIDFGSNFKFVDDSLRGNDIFVYSAARVLDDLKSLSKKKYKITKFSGHMHNAPKTIFSKLPNYLEYTDGFMKYGNDYHNIYVVISASIDFYGTTGYISTRSVKYFPSYLVINIQNGSVTSIVGRVKRNREDGFFEVDVPNAKDINF